MSGKRAKALRKQIYGADLSPRVRRYTRDRRTGQLLADERRRAYQRLKAAGGVTRRPAINAAA